MHLLRIFILVTASRQANSFCTGMTSPNNINALESNITSPGWRDPLPANEVCKWVLNVAGISNTLLKITLHELYTEGTAENCEEGVGVLEMPDGQELCGAQRKKCFLYSYNEITDAKCQRLMDRSSCRYTPLAISQWHPRITYRQDSDGRSLGFRLSYTISNCVDADIPTPGSTTTQLPTAGATTSAATKTLSRPRTRDPAVQVFSTEISTTTFRSTRYRIPLPVTISWVLACVVAILLLTLALYRHRMRRKRREPFASDVIRAGIGVYEDALDVPNNEMSGYEVPMNNRPEQGTSNTAYEYDDTALQQPSASTGTYDDAQLRNGAGKDERCHTYEEVGMGEQNNEYDL